MKAIGVNDKLIEIKNDYFSYTHENIEKIKAYDHSYDIFNILKNKNIILTDIQRYPWINKRVDMNNLKLEKKYKKNVDVFILNL